MKGIDQRSRTEGLDEGKYVRYHLFPWSDPPSSCEPDAAEPDGCKRGPWGQIYPAANDPERMGCILSDPQHNARRVRFFSQGTPGDSGTRTFIFWKEGESDQGGPSDIVGRRGVKVEGDTASTAGLRPQDFLPVVAVPTASVYGDPPDGCLVRGEEELGDGAFANTQAINLSTLSDEGGDLGGPMPARPGRRPP